MKPANHSDRERIVSIISRAFRENPTIRFLLGEGQSFDQRMHDFALYVYHMAQARNGLYLSDNRMGFMSLYPQNTRLRWWEGAAAYFHLCRAIRAERLPAIRRHTQYIESMRPKDQNHLYCWFFGVDPEEVPRTSAVEIKNAILARSTHSGLPVYAETAVVRNKLVYERFGFVTYHYWKNPENDVEVWFLKREPGTL